MSNTSFLNLFQNIALLLALILVLDSVALRVRQGHEVMRKVGIGLLVGGMGLVIMLTPWVFLPGVVFDTRSILLGISGLFFGFLPTIIAMVVTIAFRLYLGGSGAFTGALVILAMGSLGITWNHKRRHALDKTSWQEFYLFGLVSHLVMLALMFTLPWQSALLVLGSVTLPVLFLYPFGTMLLGGLMVRRIQREKASAALQEREEHLCKLAEELRNSRDMLARSQELAHVGSWNLDLQTGSLTWTDEVYRILGLKPQEFPVSYEIFLDHVHPDDRAAVDLAYSESVDRGSDSYEIEHRVVHADTGVVRFVHEKCEHIRNASGSVIQSMGMVQDITDRKLAEDNLIAGEAELHRLLDVAEWSRLALLSVLEDRMDAATDTPGSGNAPPR